MSRANPFRNMKDRPMSKISFVEMGSRDVEETSIFFAGLFGWRYHASEDPAQGGWFETPGIRIGLHGDDPAWEMVPYFRVGDIEAAVTQVRALGGWAEDRIADEDDFGRFCNCRDPQGMRFGLHQPR